MTEASLRLLCEHPLSTNCRFYAYDAAQMNAHYEEKHGCLPEKVEDFLAEMTQRNGALSEDVYQDAIDQNNANFVQIVQKD